VVTFDFEELGKADLVVDALYLGGTRGNIADDPLSKLLPVGNSGGVRINGARTNPNLIALVSSGEDPDWPDSVDRETGFVTYFGDNKHGGRELHETPSGGNIVLRNLFDTAYGAGPTRRGIAPVLLFTREGRGRDYRFLGLAVPGANATNFSDDLVAVWRTSKSLRYQNYRAIFTILDVATVSRSWLLDIRSGDRNSVHEPEVWTRWVDGGGISALTSPNAVEHRSRIDQEPQGAVGQKLLEIIYGHFSDRPVDFEYFAAEIVKMHLPDVVSLDVTRPSRDGGRDGIGQLRVGNGPGGIDLDFSVEAKCYRPGSAVGVRELARLISRLRHRQFGILVTTSHLNLQAYKELKEDRHPIIVISGGDIVRILRSTKLSDPDRVQAWLAESFPQH
jgi:hypothetical protein